MFKTFSNIVYLGYRLSVYHVVVLWQLLYRPAKCYGLS